MILHRSKIEAVFLVEPEAHRDDRGMFSEVFNRGCLEAEGICFPVEQVNLSMSLRSGTVRGLHFQEDPHGQQKLVRCLTGEVWDVVVDARPSSPTYRKHVSFKLVAGDLKSVYVPIGCAHGFQARTDFSEIQYLVSGPWNKEAERGFRPDDPALGIKWPMPISNMNQRDSEWPLL